MHTICNLFVVDATISWSLPSFTAVEESEVATICVTLEDDIERNVTVTLSSTEQSKIHHLLLFHLNYSLLLLSLLQLMISVTFP